MGKDFSLMLGFFRWLRNFPLGLAIGSAAALLLSWAVDLEVSDAFSRNAIYLFSALVTLTAATLATAGVLMTITHQTERAHDENAAKLKAALTSLPLALSNLSDIATSGAEISLGHNVEGLSRHDMLTRIRLEPEIISIIERSIEYSKGSPVDRLSAIIRSYQVLKSRLDNYIMGSGSMSQPQFHSAIEWAILYRQIGDCFGYARGEESEIPPNLSQLSLLNFFTVTLGYPYSRNEDLMDAIARAEARENPTLF